MTDFIPQNPDYAAVVGASFAKQGLMQALGIELAEVAPGRCVLVAGHDPGLLQQHGYFHGALIGAMQDAVSPDIELPQPNFKFLKIIGR